MATRPVGRDPVFKAALELARKAAPSTSPVVLVGPTGCGKSLLARWIHERGAHPQSPFLEWSAAAVPATLLEPELLGVDRGAATGVLERPGILEAAGRGTVCLVGLDELSPAQQAVLLRALEAGAVERVGGRRPIPIHCRILASFQRGPDALVAEGRLRADLLYRIDVFRVELPPLCARGEDVILLAQHFLKRACRRLQHPPVQMDASLLQAFRQHTWPGETRELEQRVEALVLLGKEVVTAEDLPSTFWLGGDALACGLRRRLTLAELKDAYVREVIARVGGSRTEAARWLGISRKALWEHLKRRGG
jgi:transcriptional regulator with PAS, ATPase and Fis domain